MHARTLITGIAITASVAAILAAQPRPHAIAAAAAVWQPALAAPSPYERPPAGLPPEPRFAADPADSLYRLARQALSRDDFQRAATLFRQIHESHPDSEYAPDAMYWEAYALFRRGSSDDLLRARQVLVRLAELHPDAAARGDTRSLRTRVEGALAARGDAD
ncbi:MAG TPA: tetratricopeptide repeat protein, partial [Gemmatimonadales bacterium]